MAIALIALYILCLALWRPRPVSLKTKLPGYWQNIKSVKATLILGIILILVFWLTSGFEFKESKKSLLGILGTSGKGFTQLNAYFQIVTNIFVHINLIHLVSNLAGLFYLSHYERRVGSGRYLMVFILSGIFSSIFSLPFHREVVAAGASAGIFGLGAAFFTDHKNLTKREWLHLVFIATFFGVIFTLPDRRLQDINIDHWGHFFGALSGIILCRLFPIPETENEIKQRRRWRTAIMIIIPLFLVFSLIPFGIKLFSIGRQTYDCTKLYQTKKYQEAFELCSKAIGPDAESVTARLYAQGFGTEKDEVKAFDLFKKSAVRGDVLAQSYLAKAYKQGKGTEVDEDMAFKWAEIAANQNDIMAQLFMAVFYNEGVGTHRDLVKAYMWLVLADKQKSNFPELPEDIMNLLLEQQAYFSRILSKEQMEEAKDMAEKWQETKPQESELIKLYNEGNKKIKDVDKKPKKKLSQSLEIQKKCVNYYSKHDYKNAIKACEQSANPKFQAVSAVMYNEGQGTKKNPEKAYEIVKDLGDNKYFDEVGTLYFYGDKKAGVLQNKQEAVKWYTHAAEKGDVNNQMRLAFWYYKGIHGAKQDYVESFKWTEKGLEAKHPQAQAMMVVFYGSGKGGVFKDNFRAKYYLKQLVEGIKDTNKVSRYDEKTKKGALAFLIEVGMKECPQIVAIYAELFRNGGWGVAPILDEAFGWYHQLAKTGYTEAKAQLAVMLYIGKNGNANKEAAVKFMTEAANEGNAFAQRQLGNFYNMGDGVKKDVEKSIEWSTKAGKNGDSYAQVNLGNIYYNGAGVEKDYSKAYYWFIKAANQNVAAAQATIADMYSSGFGVEKNYVQSYMWSSLALKQEGNVFGIPGNRENVDQTIKAALQQKIIDLTNNMKKEDVENAKNLVRFWKSSRNSDVHLLNENRLKGDEYFRHEKYQKALKEYDEAIEKNPEDAESYNNRAVLYKALEKYDNALKDLNKAIELDPYFVAAYNNRGAIYRRTNKPAEAIAEYDKASEIWPGNARSYNNRAAVYDQKNMELAIDAGEEGILINPTDAVLHYNLAGRYMNNKPNYEKAVKYYGVAAKNVTAEDLELSEWHAYFTRGTVYSIQGKHDLALEDYKKAAEYNKNIISTYKAIVLAYLKSLM